MVMVTTIIGDDAKRFVVVECRTTTDTNINSSSSRRRLDAVAIVKGILFFFGSNRFCGVCVWCMEMCCVLYTSIFYDVM